jgi:hypothetical protein
LTGSAMQHEAEDAIHDRTRNMGKVLGLEVIDEFEAA